MDQRLATLFEQCFYQHYQTRCLGGADEPLYQPADANGIACLRYRQDFPASALHEISHWCLAGKRRLQLPDFGFSYAAAPRSLCAQVEFLGFEVRPQALESLFCRAVGLPFRCSFDDLEDRFMALRPGFEAAVASAELNFIRAGLPPRGGQFLQALRRANHVGMA
ncbi:MAG: elongation factor P hydroxylase [Pseudomonadales bacterium]